MLRLLLGFILSFVLAVTLALPSCSSNIGTPDGADDADVDGDAEQDGAAIPDNASLADHPADLLDLSNWKLTLPVGTDESPLEIEQPELDSYSNPPYFQLTAAKDGVLFQAACGGVTTSGSSYPRSELREMTEGGTNEASWSTTVGTHTMFIEQAITHLPEIKQHVVAGQIHDRDDDVIVIRLEGTKLFIDLNGDDGPTLDANYTLGKIFSVRFVAQDGSIKIFYNDATTPAIDYPHNATGCYFKAGCYTQSNPSKGDTASAYGKVVIHALSVSHS